MELLRKIFRRGYYFLRTNIVKEITILRIRSSSLFQMKQIILFV